jgi:hypothetical protein
MKEKNEEVTALFKKKKMEEGMDKQVTGIPFLLLNVWFVDG